MSCQGDDGGPGSSRPSGTGVTAVARAVVNSNRASSYAGLAGRGPLTNLPHLVASQTLGSLEGKSSVEGGEYHYTLPLRLPEGPGGLTPSLGLAYSSAAGNGPLGVGWSLTGLSAISRCVHDLARDGFASGFDFNPNMTTALNLYCLDGNKLVPVSRSGATVTYQTEDADFAKIVATYPSATAGDPDSFKVWRKDGRIYTYGGDNAATHSRADGPFTGVLSGPAIQPYVPYAWHLSRIEDRDGNSIKYNYTFTENTSGYLLQICSIGQAQLCQSAMGATRLISSILWGNNGVRFDYDARPDVVQAYAFGFDLTVSRRLRAIQVFSPLGSGVPVAWSYNLGYQTSVFTNRSELISIGMKDRFDKALPATTFAWNTAPATGSPYSALDYKITPYAMGGACATSPAKCLPANFSRLLLADLNGDGRDDLVYSRADATAAAKTKLVIRLSDASGLGAELEDIGLLDATTPEVYLNTSLAADLDGDGKAELILGGRFAGAAGKLAYRVFTLGNNGLALAPASGLTAIVNALPWTWNDANLTDPRPIQIADFNGDGLPDLIAGVAQVGGVTDPASKTAPRLIYVAKDNKLNYLPAVEGPPPNDFSLTGKQVFIRDVDGDRRADILSWPNASGTMFFNTDVNGDGLPDEMDFAAMKDADAATSQKQIFCGAAPFSFKVRKNTGRGAWRGVPGASLYNFMIPIPPGKGTCTVPNDIVSTGTHYFYSYSQSYVASIRTGDFNGDGLQDLVLLNVGLDAGTLYRGDHLPTNPWATGHYTAPVLMLANGRDNFDPGQGQGEGFYPIAFPVAGGRIREDAGRFELNGLVVANGIGAGYNVYSHFWDMTAVGDINGDGLSDLVQLVLAEDGKSVRFETITAKLAEVGLIHRQDVIVKVTDGLQATARSGDSIAERISYLDLPSLTTKGRHAAACDQAALGLPCVQSGMFLVDSHWPSGRTNAAANRVEYSYGAARFDRKGRGLLGFESLTGRDFLTGTQVATKQTFKLADLTLKDDFGLSAWAAIAMPAGVAGGNLPWNSGVPGPLKGRLYYTSAESLTTTRNDFLTATPPATSPLRRTVTTTTNDLITNIPNGTSYKNTGTFLVRPKHTDVTETYLASVGAVFPSTPPDITRTVDYSYGDVISVGSPTIVASATVGGTKDAVATAYNNDITNWFIGQPSHTDHARTNAQGTVTRTTDYHYYADGRVKDVVIAPSGAADVTSTTAYAYYASGALKSVDVKGVDLALGTDVRTRHTGITYDAGGIFPAQVTDALGHVTSYTFDASLGVPIAVVDPNGVGTDYVYDGFGRKRATYPDAGQASMETLAPSPSPATEPTVAYHVSRSLTTGPDGPGCAAPPALGSGLNGRCFVEVEHDVIQMSGKLMTSSQRSLDGSWFDSKLAYDARDRLKTRTRPAPRGLVFGVASTTYTYDGLDRVISVKDGRDNVVTRSYPSAFVTDVIDQNLARTSTQRDVDGRHVRTEEAAVSTLRPGVRMINTTFEYNPFGNLITETRTGVDGVQMTSFGYDGLGRKISVTEPTSGTKTFSYNAFGELRKEQDALGSRTIKHDDLGRVTDAVDDADPARAETFRWDVSANGVGKLASVDASEPPANIVSLLFQYTPLGQQSEVNMMVLPASVNYAISQSYDSEGRPDVTTYPTTADGQRFAAKKQYNALGRLFEVRQAGSTAAALWTLAAADVASTFETTQDGVATERLFEPKMGQLSDVNIYSSGLPGAPGPAMQKYHYAYRNNGSLLSRDETVSGVSETFAYDSLDRLEVWKHTLGVTSFRREYSYDDWGDVTGVNTFDSLTGTTPSESVAYGLGAVVGGGRLNPSAVISDGSSSYGYDVLGRRTSKTTGATVVTTTYNHWDLPATVTTTVVANLQYNGFGQRAVKRVGPIRNTYYLGDLFEDRAVGTTNHTCVCHVQAYGRTVAEVSQKLVSGVTQTTFLFPHLDALGSTSLLTSSGVAAKPFYYEPFGARVAEDGRTGMIKDTLEHADFTGQENDDWGLINMKGRLYDPVTRRFLSPDPIVLSPTRSQSHNPYSYVRNNPLRFTDPSGFTEEDESHSYGKEDPIIIDWRADISMSSSEESKKKFGGSKTAGSSETQTAGSTAAQGPVIADFYNTGGGIGTGATESQYYSEEPRQSIAEWGESFGQYTFPFTSSPTINMTMYEGAAAPTAMPMTTAPVGAIGLADPALYAYRDMDPIDSGPPLRAPTHIAIGQAVGWSGALGSHYLPVLGGLFGIALPSSGGVSAGILDHLDLSTGDFTIGVYAAALTSIAPGFTPVTGEAGTDFSFFHNVSDFGGGSVGPVGSAGPVSIAARGDLQAGTFTIGASNGSSTGVFSQETSVYGLSIGFSGIHVIRY